jgi:hypothetical protein
MVPICRALMIKLIDDTHDGALILEQAGSGDAALASSSREYKSLAIPTAAALPARSSPASRSRLQTSPATAPAGSPAQAHCNNNSGVTTSTASPTREYLRSQTRAPLQTAAYNSLAKQIPSCKENNCRGANLKAEPRLAAFAAESAKPNHSEQAALPIASRRSRFARSHPAAVAAASYVSFKKSSTA